MLIFYLALAIAITTAFYRLYKRCTRPCQFCGSIRFKRYGRNEMRVPEYPRECVSTMIKVCTNPSCIAYGKEMDEESHPAHFSRPGYLWRRFVKRELFF